MPQRIQRSALDQRLQYSLVEQPKIDVLAELVNRLETSQLLPRCDNRLNRIASDVLHRRQPKANGLSMRREVRIRHVDVRRFDRNAHFAAFVAPLPDIR